MTQRFSELLLSQRQSKGMSQRTLAKRLADRGLSVDPSSIARMENGQREPKLGEALAICEELDIDLLELAGKSDLQQRANEILGRLAHRVGDDLSSLQAVHGRLPDLLHQPASSRDEFFRAASSEVKREMLLRNRITTVLSDLTRLGDSVFQAFAVGTFADSELPHSPRLFEFHPVVHEGRGLDGDDEPET